MNLSPVQILVLLLLLGLAASGWFYGIHWKQIATGTHFTQEERFMIQLQDQIEILDRRNAELREELARLQDPEEHDKISAKEKPGPASPRMSAPLEPIELPTKGF